MSKVTGYQLVSYGDMITDTPRMDAYAQALQQAVKPESIVLDIGAGTGIFSLLACQLGARLVHAIEPNDAIDLARLIAAANGCKDRIVFHQQLSTEMTLPTRAVVMISDLRGILPLLQHHIPAIIDARDRLLVPGGAMIPQKDTLWAALVHAPELYRPYEEPWLSNKFDLDMRAGHSFVVNSWRKAHLKTEQLLSIPQRWAILDYETITTPHVAGELSWEMEKEGVVHGLLLWFDTTLAEGIGFSNAPGQPDLIYGQAFFPLPHPVPLAAGDTVSIRLGADLIGNEYIWRWATHIVDGQDRHTVKADYKQSTFYGQPVTTQKMHKQAANFVPHLDDKGEVDLFILNLMDGSRSLEEIAQQTHKRFPERFPDWRNALARAGEVSQRHSR